MYIWLLYLFCLLGQGMGGDMYPGGPYQPPYYPPPFLRAEAPPPPAPVIFKQGEDPVLKAVQKDLKRLKRQESDNTDKVIEWLDANDQNVNVLLRQFQNMNQQYQKMEAQLASVNRFCNTVWGLGVFGVMVVISGVIIGVFWV